MINYQADIAYLYIVRNHPEGDPGRREYPCRIVFEAADDASAVRDACRWALAQQKRLDDRCSTPVEDEWERFLCRKLGLPDPPIWFGMGSISIGEYSAGRIGDDGVVVVGPARPVLEWRHDVHDMHPDIEGIRCGWEVAS